MKPGDRTGTKTVPTVRGSQSSKGDGDGQEKARLRQMGGRKNVPGRGKSPGTRSQAGRRWGSWSSLRPHLFHHGMQSHSGEVEFTQQHAQDLAGPSGKDMLSAPSAPGSWEGTPAPAHP